MGADNDNSAEEWRAIADAPGYEVSSVGRVRSWRKDGPGNVRRMEPRILSPWHDKGGYASVRLPRDGKWQKRMVHHLVLESFIGPRPAGMECRHYPENNPRNNRVENISWSTHVVNIQDRHEHGTNALGDRNGSRTKPERRPRGPRNGTHTKPDSRPRGERCGAARATEDTVRGIRSADGKLKDIAGRFGISISAAHAIRTRKTWRHVG